MTRFRCAVRRARNAIAPNAFAQNAIAPRQAPPALFEPLELRRLLSASPAVEMFARPMTGALPAGSASVVGYTPAQIRRAFGFDAISFNGITGDGAGQTIAVINAFDNPKFVNSTSSAYSSSDLHKFSVQFGLPDPPSFRKVDQFGGSAYPSSDPGWANEAALDVEWVHAIAPKANILLVEAKSTSFTDLVQGAVQYARQQPGVSVITMSFAAFEAASETFFDSYFTTPAGHAGVSFVAASGDSGSPAGYPAYSPNVVAVGGTRLSLSGNNYVSETGHPTSGGGISLYETKPAYQSGVTQSATNRTAPDVAFNTDSDTGVAVYDSFNGGASTPWYKVGGTSLGAPVWAGLIGITNQGRKLAGLSALDGPGQTLPKLYQLSSGDFHDITTGNNGFSAGSGYDLVTGRGTPRANTLIPHLGGLATSTNTASISGNLFNDLNGDGSRQSGEPNLSGRKFYLDTNKNAKLDSGEKTATTNSSGNYKFTGLAAGTYRVREAIPSGWRVSLPATAWYRELSVSTGQSATGQNFADTRRVLIAGNVFNDLNASGSKNSGEGGLSGWRVYVDLNNDGKWQSNENSKLTDANGYFRFVSLAAGTYHLRIVVPSGWKQTLPGNNSAYNTTLASGQGYTGKLFGARS